MQAADERRVLLVLAIHLGAYAPYALGLQDIEGASAEAAGSNHDLLKRSWLGSNFSNLTSAEQRDSAVLAGEGLPPGTSHAAMHHHDESYLKLSVEQPQDRVADRHLLGDRPPTAVQADELFKRRCAFEVTPAAVAALGSAVTPLIEGSAISDSDATFVNVWFHVILPELRTSDPKDSVFVQQVAILNRDFVATGLNFRLANVSRVVNKNWTPMDIDSPAYHEMRDSLHIFGYADLNIFVGVIDNNGVIGVGTFPGSRAAKRDGVSIHIDTLPGGAHTGYNLGKNLVHETGHWLGLAHPFEGGCTEPNDGVEDTAQQRDPNYECYKIGTPASRLPNSCPNRPAGQPKTDPVQNYMGYAPDACMARFTPMQMELASAAWHTFRAPSERTPEPLFVPKDSPPRGPGDPAFGEFEAPSPDGSPRQKYIVRASGAARPAAGRASHTLLLALCISISVCMLFSFTA